MARRHSRLTINEVRGYYRMFNRNFFFNSLPAWVEIRVAQIRGSNGECSRLVDKDEALMYYRIEFSKDIWRCGRRVVCIILLHEMSHLAAGLEENHGKGFEANKRRLIRLGAYNQFL